MASETPLSFGTPAEGSRPKADAAGFAKGNGGPPILQAAGGNFRWTICGLLFFATMINYMDRAVIGVLKKPLSLELGWTENSYATIVMAFQIAYAFGYLFGGRLMDHFGVKRGLPWTAFLWSVAAAAHGLVRSVLGFSVARVGLGLSEGGNFPAAIKTVGQWFPVQERALATGIFNSASNIGAIVCPLFVPWLAIKYGMPAAMHTLNVNGHRATVEALSDEAIKHGWPAAFFITGALGLVWVVAWVLLYDAPETHPRLSASERTYIEEGRLKTADAGVSWGSLLRFRATWGYLVAQILTTWVWWFYLFWLPGFLQTRYNLSNKEANFRVAVVYTMAIFGSIAAGSLAGNLIRRGWSVNAARKFALLICALCVVPVVAVPMVANSWVTVLLVGLAAAAHQGTSANLFTVASDVMPKRAVSSLVGLGGFVAGIAAAGNAKAVGEILTRTHGSYTLIFFFASTMYLFALLFLHLLIPKIEPVGVNAEDWERRKTV